jgi:hypothetical protein
LPNPLWFQFFLYLLGLPGLHQGLVAKLPSDTNSNDPMFTSTQHSHVSHKDFLCNRLTEYDSPKATV